MLFRLFLVLLFMAAGLVEAQEIRPSYRAGFARSAAESAYPGLWDGLVGAWSPSLGVTGDELKDVSFYNNHGTLTNMDAGTDWVGGKFGRALDFDGVDDYVDAGNDSSLNLTGSFALSAWIKPDSIGTYEGIVTREISNTGYYMWFGPSNNRYIGFGVNGGGGANEDEIQSNSQMVLNEWVHIVGVFNGVNKKIYVNGILNKTGGNSTSAISNVGTNYIGGSAADGNLRFPGLIDDVRIYNRALSADEIKQLYINPNTPFQLRSQVVKAPAAAPTGTGSVYKGVVLKGVTTN